jgi:isopentenyldiphosphate isomerase
MESRRSQWDRSDAASELVDVLDEDGRVVGSTTRAEMRRLRLPHRCVYVFVFHPDGRLLIHRRTDSKEVFPGFWDVAVGGVVSAGEEWLAAAVRETAEEIGVDVEPTYHSDFHFDSGFGFVFGRIYSAVHAGPFTLQESEVAEASFVPLDDLEALFASRTFCPDGIAAWRQYVITSRS